MIPLSPLSLLLRFVRCHCDLMEQSTAPARSDAASRSALQLCRELREAAKQVEAEMPVAMLALKQLAERAADQPSLRGALDQTMAVLELEASE